MSERKPNLSVNSVLVADDHGVTRFGLMEFLKSKLHVRSAFEAQRFGDALQILKNQKVDLAIFDLGIPGLRSAKDLGQIREQWPNMRLVVLSGSELRSNILAALEAGVHGYIVKTETMEDLAERLGYVISGGIYVPPSLADRTAGMMAEAQASSSIDQPAAGLPKITQRQKQVLRGIITGQSNKQIANDLKLSVGTVKMHVSAVLTALGAQNRSHAASLGRRLLD